MRVLDEIVLGLAPVRVAGDALMLPQGAEILVPAGEQLVHIGLMPGVEQDAVDRRVEYPVQCDRELDHAQVGTEVTAVFVTILIR